MNLPALVVTNSSQKSQLHGVMLNKTFVKFSFSLCNLITVLQTSNKKRFPLYLAVCFGPNAGQRKAVS